MQLVHINDIKYLQTLANQKRLTQDWTNIYTSGNVN